MTPAGSVRSLWRYPVKSMLGEELDSCEVGDRGLAGDRAYALSCPWPSPPAREDTGSTGDCGVRREPELTESQIVYC